MTNQRFVQRAAFKRTFVAVALATAYAGAWALEPFTFTPSAVGLTGAPITADNIIVSDFATVTFTGPTTFQETGLLSVTGFQLGGTNVVADGLNSDYSLYFRFNGTGTLTQGSAASDPRTTVTAGVFNTLDYELIASSGNATFGFTGNTPTVTTPGGATQTTLATGSLINGNVVSSPSPTPDTAGFVPSANATVSFNIAPGAGSFFSPQPFYGVAFTAFTNSVSTVEPFANGFRVNNGGGNINFAAPIPEPETYALMLAGLGLVATVVRRRSANRG